MGNDRFLPPPRELTGRIRFGVSFSFVLRLALRDSLQVSSLGLSLSFSFRVFRLLLLTRPGFFLFSQASSINWTRIEKDRVE